MSAAAVSRVLVAMSMFAFKSYDDCSQSISTRTSAVSNYCYDSSQGANNNYEDWTELDGLILARKGSKGIPHKNMAQLNGHPLIYYALTAMMQSQVFARIWVSTDDPLVSDYINSLNKNMTERGNQIKIHHRAWYTATDEATSLIAVQEFLQTHPEVRTIGLVQVTSPFIQPSFLKDAAQLMKRKKLDTVFSVTRQHKFRWSEVVQNEIIEELYGVESEWTKPLNFNPKSRPTRQSWSGELVENGMFYFVTAKTISDGLIQGPRSFYYEIPKKLSLEIDSIEDLTYAEVLMMRNLTST